MADELADLVSKASKKYNGLVVGNIDDVVSDVNVISTGNIAIDTIIGIGGFPLGRSIELFGPPSCGKTTTALQSAGELQKTIIAGGDESRGIHADDVILFLDYEQTIDPDYAKALGFDMSHPSVLTTQPDTLEDGVNFAIAAIKTGRIRLVIVDSVASMNPSAKAEAEIGKSLPAVQAKLLKDFGLTMNSVLSNHNCSAIYLNHQVEVMSMGGPSRPGMGPRISTPGGAAMKYFASLRIQYTQIKTNKGMRLDPLTNSMQEYPISTDVKVKVIKNKVAPTGREAIVRVRFGRGFDNLWSSMQVLIANKKIVYSTGYFYFHNLADYGLVPEWMERAKTGQMRPFVRGEEHLYQIADQNPDWREGLIAVAEEVVKENSSAVSASYEEEGAPEDLSDDLEKIFSE